LANLYIFEDGITTTSVYAKNTNRIATTSVCGTSANEEFAITSVCGAGLYPIPALVLSEFVIRIKKSL